MKCSKQRDREEEERFQTNINKQNSTWIGVSKLVR